MQQSPYSFCRAWKKRGMSLFLALVLVLGLFPGVPGLEGEASAHWADPYLSQLVEWGFIRSDQAGYPDRALTRADFMAITNRAYGYHETGETPFEDVDEKDWYYDDVGIAYTARYIKGTSPTTASPKSTLTRETAATILGRNMMLQESAGELLDFADARQISSWAKGTVKSSLEHYLVSGYDDGTFRPQRNVSWGEMAAMVTKLIGTPLQEPGDYALGGTFGNVTITSPGVTLRDTVISGDLYVTGGVGLGDVKLENVTVLGRIIASGAGSSEGGGASILLRNVIADELLVDNLQDNPVSVKADGITEIGHTTVRTTAFIEDNTPDGMGLHHISLEGESYPEGEEPEDWEPPVLTLAGRIEEVVNKTPNSIVHAASGTVAKLTVDEAAEGSAVVIDRNTVVKELNLDTTTTVTGEGDVGKLVVNAPGCVVEMLPDEIEIRPGITAEINGEEMDSVAAQESSEEPQILAGYPEARDIIPTGLDAVFMTNKAGTVYWAVSAITDGSVGEEDLIKPPSYGNIAVSNGSLKVAKGNEETTAKIGGLTPGGSYYLSAVLVDARDKRSTTKVISFTTPDNTTPAFCAGYPYMSQVSRTDSVVVVMPNKDCKLYYALLPEGAAAPTENELKTSSVAGALGYGVRDVKKNVEDTFRVNDVILDEQVNYVLYLWLVDADGVNKGKIVSLKFTTKDETPPEFIVDPTPNKIQANSVSLTFRLNENGTVYWVAVPAGTIYPKPEPGTEFEYAPENSEYGKMQIESGMNIGSDGKAGKVTAKENTDGTITVSGLKPEVVYDFYYVAKDTAGNYSVVWKKITISTLDVNPPVIKQFFELTSDPNDNTTKPTADSDIYLDINENVKCLGQNGGTSFRELYDNVRTASGAEKIAAINLWALNLFNAIKLNKVNGNVEEIHERGAGYDFTDDITIDYTQAYITTNPNDSNGIRIVFPSEGLHLESGARYYFTVTGLYDTSDNQNQIQPDPIDFTIPARRAEAIKNGHSLEPFDVAPPTVWFFTDPGVGSGDGPTDRNADGSLKQNDDKTAYVSETPDRYFRIDPRSTTSTNSTMSYDILMWSNLASTDFSLYYRVIDPDSKTSKRIDKGNAYPDTYTYKDPNAGADAEGIEIEDYLILPDGTSSYADLVVDDNGWIWLGTNTVNNLPASGWSAKSVNALFNNCDATDFPQLKNLNDHLEYEFVISLERFKGDANRDIWSGDVKFQFDVIAGQSSILDQVSSTLTRGRDYLKTNYIDKGLVSNIGWWDQESQPTLELEWSRLAIGMPSFANRTPTFSDITHESVTMNVSLSSTGTIHYVVDLAKSTGDHPEIPTTRKVTPEEKEAIEQANLPESIWVDNSHTEIYITFENLPNDVLPPPMSGIEAMPSWMMGTPGDTWDSNTSEDDPLGTNQITLPSFDRVGSFDDLWDGPEPVAHGSFAAGPSRPTAEVIEGLEPSTDYYVYIVIDNDAGSQSHGYIYHFKTNPTMKPKITIRPESDGSAWLATDNAATMAFVLFTVSDATSEQGSDADKLKILKDDFAKYVDGANNTTPEYGVTGEIPSVWANLSVLEAMKTPYSLTDIDQAETGIYIPKTTDGLTAPYEGGYSVFDIYAGGTIRRQMDELIRNNIQGEGTTATRIDYGSGINTPGNNEAVKQALKDVNEGNEYVILTVAVNSPPRGDEKDKANYEIESFKAYAPIEKSAGAAPNLKMATLADAKLDPDPTLSGKMDSFTGTLTLTFDKSLWTHNANGENVILDKDNIDRIQFTPAKSVTLTTTGSATNGASDTITVEFEQLRSGQVVTLPGNPKQFYNASDAGAEEQMTIELKREERTEENYKRLYVWYVVTWGIEGKDPDYQQFTTNEIPVREEKLPDPPPDTNDSTYTIDRPSQAPAQKPTLTLSANSVTLDMGSSAKKTSTVTVKSVTPSGSAVTWKSANESIATVSGGKITGKSIGTTTVTATVTTSAGTASKIVTVKVTDSVTGLTLTSSTGKQPEWNEKNKTLTMYRGSTTSGNTMPSATFTVATNSPIPNTAQVYCAVMDANGKELKTNFITCERTSGGKIKVTVKGGAPEGTAMPVKVSLGLQAKTGGADLTANHYTFTIKISGNDSSLNISSR